MTSAPGPRIRDCRDRGCRRTARPALLLIRRAPPPRPRRTNAMPTTTAAPTIGPATSPGSARSSPRPTETKALGRLPACRDCSQPQKTPASGVKQPRSARRATTSPRPAPRLPPLLVHLPGRRGIAGLPGVCPAASGCFVAGLPGGCCRIQIEKRRSRRVRCWGLQGSDSSVGNWPLVRHGSFTAGRLS